MPDIEGVPYEATGGKLDQSTAERIATLGREWASAGVSAAIAAGASALVDAKAYTDQKVTGFATTVAMNAADALTLSNAKTYTDEQLAGLDLGSGIETVFGTVTLDATGEPIREFYTTGATTFNANGHTTLISAFTAVVWKRDGSGRWAYAVVDVWKDTLPPTPDTTAPTPGVLAVSNIAATSATLTVSGAIDNQALASSPYRFSVDNGASWSTWRSSPTFTVDGLTGSTVYNALAEVKDAAGLTARTAVEQFTTLAEPVVPFTFTGAAGTPLTGMTYRGNQFGVTSRPGVFFGSTSGLPSANDTPLALTGANSAKGRGQSVIETGAADFEASVDLANVTKVTANDQVRLALNFATGDGAAIFVNVLPNEGNIKFYVNGTQIGETLPMNGATSGAISLKKQGQTITVTFAGQTVGTTTLPTGAVIGTAVGLMGAHPDATFSNLLIQPL